MIVRKTTYGSTVFSETSALIVNAAVQARAARKNLEFIGNSLSRSSSSTGFLIDPPPLLSASVCRPWSNWRTTDRT